MWNRCPAAVPCFFFPERAAFSEEEKAYLQTNPTIKVCVNPNLAPFEFLTLDGEYEGIGGNINTNKNFTHGKSFFMYNVCTALYL